MDQDDNKTVPMIRDARGRFVKGHSGNPGGKPQGAVSKLTQLKEDFFTIYDKLGGMEGLLGWAKEHPTEFYTMLYKLMPRTADADAQVAGLSYEARLRRTVTLTREDQYAVSTCDEFIEEEDT